MFQSILWCSCSTSTIRSASQGLSLAGTKATCLVVRATFAKGKHICALHLLIQSYKIIFLD
jgi:hypothetical protein